MFWVAHDDCTGQPRLHGPVMGLVLAGALLGELVLAGRLHVGGGVLAVTDVLRPADWLAHRVRDEIATELRRINALRAVSGADAELRTIGAWLSYLGGDARDQVGERLLRAGLVQRDRSRRPWRRQTWYVPVDINAAAWPGTRLRDGLTRGEPLGRPDVVLAGLVRACGLHRQVLWDTHPVALRNLDHLHHWLPAALREVVEHTTAAIGAAVLAHRS